MISRLFTDTLASLCHTALDLLFPPCCRQCATPVLHGLGLCPDCLASVSPTFSRRGKRLFLGDHRGLLRSVVLDLKEGRVGAEGRQLAHLLGRLCRNVFPGADRLVAVPSSPAVYAERGYNPAALLAELLAASSGIPLAADELLVKIRECRKQARLGARERRRNVKGAFKASRRLAGLKVIVVDDVCTTGSTVEACREALEEVSAVFHGAAFLAGRALFVHSPRSARVKEEGGIPA